MTLVGYWPLNEDSDASEAKDHSGNENHGTINDGGDSTVPGANGILGQKAYSFDGNNDYINMGNPDTNSITDSSNWAIAFWAKVDSATNAPVAFGESKDETSTDALALVYYGDTNTTDTPSVRFYLNGENPVLDSGDSIDVSDGEWHHVVVAQRDNDDRELFIDGVSRDTNNENIPPITVNSRTLGAFSRGGSVIQQYFHGILSEVRIYDRPLTKSEVQYLYLVGKRGLQTTSKKTS